MNLPLASTTRTLAGTLVSLGVLTLTIWPPAMTIVLLERTSAVAGLMIVPPTIASFSSDAQALSAMRPRQRGIATAKTLARQRNVIRIELLFRRFRHGFLSRLETDLGMGAVAEWLGRGGATAAERHALFHRIRIVIIVFQLDRAINNVRTVFDHINSYFRHSISFVRLTLAKTE